MTLQLSENQVRGIAVTLLFAFGLAYVVNVLSGDGRFDARGDAIGCDFLAFYGAGKDVLAGRTDRLYDFEHQREVQRQAIGAERMPYYYPYVNPPFYAAWFSPLAKLPYVPAFCVWVVSSLLFTLLSVWLIGREFGFSRPTTVTCMLGAVAFPASVMNLLGGQNAALSLLLLTACVVLQRRERLFAAGLVLGGLLFKPQLVITLAILWIIKRQWRALAGLGAVAVTLAIASFLLWPDASMAYAQLGPKLSTLLHQGSYETWKQNSWYGFFTLTMHPTWPSLLRVLTLAACMLTFVLLLPAWRGAWQPRSDRFPLQMAAAIVASALISPHLYMYDLAILILPGLLLVEYARRVGEFDLCGSLLLWPTLLYFGLPLWLSVARHTSVAVGPLLLLGMLIFMVRRATAAASPMVTASPTDSPEIAPT